MGYTYPKTDIVELSPSGAHVVHQTPAFQPERLASLVQEQPVQLQMRITALVDGSEQVILKNTKYNAFAI